MAGKNVKNTKVESDLAGCREEGNWTKILELSEQLSSSKALLYNLMIGEAKLEMFLEENPPVESNIAKACIGLVDAKTYLTDSINELNTQAGMNIDGHMLLAKLCYACGEYEEAMHHCSEAKLNSVIQTDLQIRNIRILAESFAVKGLCQEKLRPSSSSRFKKNEWLESVIKNYEQAANLGILYLQELDNKESQLMFPSPIGGAASSNANNNTLSTTGCHSPQPVNMSHTLSILVETAILRLPLLLIESSNYSGAISAFRNILSACEAHGTHSIRLVLTYQFAEFLLRKVSPKYYSLPTQNTPTKKQIINIRKSKKYNTINMFVPRSEHEEIILLLIISEAMATRNAVLSQSPEFKDARIRAFSLATAIYDLLTFALVLWGQYNMLHESFERAMKFSADDAHVWMQQALCLEAAGRHIRALEVLTLVINMQPNSSTPCLLAAKICYQHLFKMEEGLNWSEEALKREQRYPQNLLSRCHLYIAIGAQCMAVTTLLKSVKDKYHAICLESLLKAQQLDSNDHLVHYYLAFYYASIANVSEATVKVRQALTLNPEHTPSLQLAILLLSAQKKMNEAKSLLESSLEDFPDHIGLLFIRAKIELHSEASEIALTTAKHMLSMCKASVSNEGSPSIEHADTRSIFQLYTTEHSDKDTNSLGPVRIEQALSEVASSISSLVPQRPIANTVWHTQQNVWLLLAEIYLAQDQFDAANNCLLEAASIFPLSHHIMYMRGLFHEKRNEFNEAKQCYQNAVTVHPAHLKSLQHLGLMYHYLGSHRLAEKTLRDAAKINPYSPETWYNLGKVLESLGETSSATDSMATALQVEMVSPIMQYTSIPLPFD
ncbi:tetratricopeptide repeat protein 7B [Adelges cooleyi]|uniref:tetratricopeptide repeat protein 7B n=1 Tax=Adelges cooleyi TaxID=133065 RepID=UPI00217F6B58|nr:tetratricopeptide repeat protein 7B [Adelges cooleyi]